MVRRARLLWALLQREGHHLVAALAGPHSQDSCLPQPGVLLLWEMLRLGNALLPQSLSSGACPVAGDDQFHWQSLTSHSFLLYFCPWAKILITEDFSEYILLLNAKKTGMVMRKCQNQFYRLLSERK
jgi:hypothetical protein